MLFIYFKRYLNFCEFNFKKILDDYYNKWKDGLSFENGQGMNDNRGDQQFKFIYR